MIVGCQEKPIIIYHNQWYFQYFRARNKYKIINSVLKVLISVIFVDPMKATSFLVINIFLTSKSDS